MNSQSIGCHAHSLYTILYIVNSTFLRATDNAKIISRDNFAHYDEYYTYIVYHLQYTHRESETDVDTLGSSHSHHTCSNNLLSVFVCVRIRANTMGSVCKYFFGFVISFRFLTFILCCFSYVYIFQIK